MAAGAADLEGPALTRGRGELRVAVAGEEAYRAPIEPDVRFEAVAPLDGDRWVAAGVRAGSALLLVRGEGSAAERLSVPATGGRLVAAPVPLTADGDLVGLAWLAGDDPRRLTVRFARWEGGSAVGSWSETERVAGPARGTQTALSGTVLADGSALLLWSAFDGQDDEILWSRRSGGRWSAPAPVAAGNRVPDVTPVVAAVDDGAIAAWSRYRGGEYQLVTARWTGSPETPWGEVQVTGPPGSVLPELRSEEDGALLLYREARRRGWTVLRLDAGGRVTARAFVSLPSAEATPALVGSDRDGVALAMPRGGVRKVRWEPVP